jgi:hypothetical protein
MRRFHIAWLMGLILVIALGMAALRNASDLWVGVTLLATTGLLGFGLIGLAYRRDAKRAWWFGFSLFGWGYLTLAHGPWFAQEVGPKLPTTQLLMYVHSRAHPTTSGMAIDFALSSVSSSGGSPGTLVVSQPQNSALSANPTWGPAQAPPSASGTPVVTATPSPSQGGVFLVNVLLGNSGNPAQFAYIGHCLFALVAAFAGGLLAIRMHQTREPRPTS